MQARKAWTIFAVVGSVALGLDYGYVQWRASSLEPLTADIDLTQPRTYQWNVRGFHSSKYHPEFRLFLPLAPLAGSEWGTQFDRLWGNSPPEIDLQIRRPNGKVVLVERGKVTGDNGWIVTGGPGSSTVQVYKFAEFKPRIFSSYRVRLRIIQGSPMAAGYRPQFNVAVIKSYALVPSVTGFLLLVVAFITTALILGSLQWIAHVDDRKTERNRRRP